MGAFDGLAEIYEKSRHGYPEELRDHLVEVGALGPESTVVDLGAGTGQLAAMASQVALNVIAIDPEPDMVEVGRQATLSYKNITWMLGSDNDLVALLEPSVDLVLIGNAFHHMDQSKLLDDLDSVAQPGGVVVVCSTSIPVWLQDNDWSRALRRQLSTELGRAIGEGGTPNHEAEVEVLHSSPFSDVTKWEFARDLSRSAKSIVGEVVSSASGAIDEPAAERLLAAIDPHLTGGSIVESVRTTALLARRPSP